MQMLLKWNRESWQLTIIFFLLFPVLRLYSLFVAVEVQISKHRYLPMIRLTRIIGFDWSKLIDLYDTIFIIS